MEPPPALREVIEVATGIPAFLGTTAWARGEAGEDLAFVPTPIGSDAELEERFGPPAAEPLELDVREDAAGAFAVTALRGHAVPARGLAWAVRLFFANGGRRCWVVSVGSHAAPLALGGSAQAPGLREGLAALAGVDEPDLVLLPDALALAAEEHATLARELLAWCGARRDRFAILDVRAGLAELDEAALATARELFGHECLDRGAAYYPFLRTTWGPLVVVDEASGTSNVRVSLALASGARRTVDLVALRAGAPAGPDGGDPPSAAPPALPPLPAVHDLVLAALAERRLVLPPSGAVAGVYAATDETRGVWKAPANVALAAVEAPAVAVDDAQQQQLNVDAETGRSINAVRAFPGRGTVIWGARTLAGNSSDWRYVPVRRFLAMLEESIDRSTRWVVHEPNEARTWAAARASVERYLVGKWREGALSGTTADEAFSVRCGLGSTMTAGDVAAGRLVIEVFLAPLRPAEFVVLRFAHTRDAD